MSSMKLPLFLLVFLIPGYALAASDGAFNGFYVGGELGSTFNQGTLSTQTSDTLSLGGPGAFVNSPINASATLANTAFKGVLSLGYGKELWTYFYLGTQAFIDLSQYQLNSTFSNKINADGNINAITSNSLKESPFQYGLDLKPGVLLDNNSLLYALVGFAVAQTQLNQETNGVIAPNGSTPFSIQTSSNNNSTHLALRLGLGIEKFISRYFSIKADYVFTNYASGQTSSSINDLSSSSSLSNNSQGNLNSNAVFFGLSYYFSHPVLEAPGFFSQLPQPENTRKFRGFYLGSAVGSSMTSTQINNQVSNTANMDGLVIIYPINTLSTYGDNAVKGVFSVGYGYAWSWLYMGLEGFVDASSYEVNSNNERWNSIANNIYLQATTKISSALSDIQFGMDFRPGFLMTSSSLLYARIGTAFSNMSLTANHFNTISAGGGGSMQSFPLSISQSTNKETLALRLGGGFEQSISANVSLRADYIWTDYGSLSTQGFNSSQGGTFTISNQSQVKTTNNTVTLGMNYYFR